MPCAPQRATKMRATRLILLVCLGLLVACACAEGGPLARNAQAHMRSLRAHALQCDGPRCLQPGPCRARARAGDGDHGRQLLGPAAPRLARRLMAADGCGCGCYIRNPWTGGCTQCKICTGSTQFVDAGSYNRPQGYQRTQYCQHNCSRCGQKGWGGGCKKCCWYA